MDPRELARQMMSRRIVLMTEITVGYADFLRNRLSELCADSEEEVTLLIDSQGGKMESAFRIHDFISVPKLPVNGLVLGTCESAAIIVLMACRSRLATPHSTFHFHQTNVRSVFVAGGRKKDYIAYIEAQMRQSARYRKLEADILRRRTKLNSKQIKQLKESGEAFGERLTVQEALRFGLIDAVVRHFKLFDSAWWVQELIRLEREEKQSQLVPSESNIGFE